MPLSFAQQRLWFLAQMEGVSDTYHIPAALRLRGELDGEALKRSLDGIWARHEGLRSVFVMVEGEPRCRVAAGGGERVATGGARSAGSWRDAEAE